MAGTTVVRTGATPMGSIEREAAAQVNNLVDDVEALRGALSAGGVVAVTELMADHATFKTAVDQTETLVEELHDDHATFKSAVDSLKTLADELKADFNLLRLNLVNACYVSAGLAEGTNANTIQTASAITYMIGGQLYTKAATDNIAITAGAQQAISTYCLYLVTINAAGTVTTTKGTELGTDTAVLPARPASEAVIGAFKIATDGATTYTAGTTDNGAAGITDTYYNLGFANSGADAATAIAAADATAGPATLTAAKPASAPATLSAAVPSSTAVDAVGDMTAAKIEDASGEVA